MTTTTTCQHCGAAMTVYADRLACTNGPEEPRDCGKTQPLPPAYEVERRGGARLPGFEGEPDDAR